MDELQAGIDRSQRLIEKLLQVARAEPDVVVRKREAVDLAELARSTVARMNTQADQHQLDLGAVTKEGLIVEGDPDQLAVLLDNLVENALRYTPAGGAVDVWRANSKGCPPCASSTAGRGFHWPSANVSSAASTGVAKPLVWRASRAAADSGCRSSVRSLNCTVRSSRCTTGAGPMAVAWKCGLRSAPANDGTGFENSAHRPQYDAGVGQPPSEFGARKDLELGQPRFKDRIGAIEGQARMAHQQVRCACPGQPAAQMRGIRFGVGAEGMDTEQGVVAPEPPLPRSLGQLARTQGIDQPRLEAERCTRGQGRPDRAAQPRTVAAAATAQLFDQFAAHDRKLMHVLVTVDIVGRTSEGVLESVQLAPDLRPQQRPVDPARPALEHQAPERPCGKGAAGSLGQVQVQAEVDSLALRAMAVEIAQRVAPSRPGRTADHAADGVHPACLRQQQRRLVDAPMQAVVVDRNADGARPAGVGSTLFAKSTTRRSAQGGRIHWFIAVGCAAALVHWVVVVSLVSRAGWLPLVANVAGWLIAFVVSYSGHRRWTFSSHDAPVGRSLRRFFVVSASGFVVNEGIYALLLQERWLRYDAVLAIVLVGVAGFTYWLSRHWAFLRSQAP